MSVPLRDGATAETVDLNLAERPGAACRIIAVLKMAVKLIRDVAAWSSETGQGALRDKGG